MEAFSFHNPTKILFGKGQVPHLGKAMQKDGIRRPLLIAGEGSIRRNGLYDAVIFGLSAAGITPTEGWGVRPNPRLDKVHELIALARENEVDAILGVGGGSVIDTAKAVAAGYYLEDIWSAFQGTVTIEKALPIYSVLSLSGTGSEMNGNAVITNTATQQKWGIGSRHLYPRLSILDPSFQSSLSFRQTASGAMDAIAHILEYFFADGRAKVTLAMNAAILKTIVEMTDRLQVDAADYEARANLAWASTMALNGMSEIGLIGGDWACHAIEHAFSALHPQIAHGEGLAVIFPAWIGFVSMRKPELFCNWAREVWGELNINRALHLFRQKLGKWEMPTSLRDLSLKEEDLPRLVELVFFSGVQEIGGIYKLNQADLKSLLMLAF